MNILYLSCHSILEYDEVKLLRELGHNVFPLGAYTNGQGDGKRPPLDPPEPSQLQDIAIQTDRSSLHPELVAWADVIIVMHKYEWVIDNLPKGKPVVWRTIGQSISSTEGALADARSKGLKIVRYSPGERNIPGYIGEDALIRFYKDPDEYKGWTGQFAVVCNFTQSMPDRAAACHFDTFKQVLLGGEYPIPAYLYGPGNDESGFQGGLLTYEKQKEVLQNCRVYFYTGTEPASYTLNLIEAMMTGIPVVALGKKLGNNLYDQDSYEVPTILEGAGFVSDDIEELRAKIKELLGNGLLAKEMGARCRARAIELFGKDAVKEQWRVFLECLND